MSVGEPKSLIHIFICQLGYFLMNYLQNKLIKPETVTSSYYYYSFILNKYLAFNSRAKQIAFFMNRKSISENWLELCSFY